MRLLKQLSVLAMHQVLGQRAESIIEFVRDRSSDPSQRLVKVLMDANDRSWKAMEIALAGDSWWTRCKGKLSGPEMQEFRKQVEAFLAADLIPEGRGRDPRFRQSCLGELRDARKANLLPGELPLHADEVAGDAAQFTRYSDPQRVVQEEMSALGGIADGLRLSGYANLGEFVSIRPSGGLPLLLIAVRYFFRREIMRDPKLSQQFMLDRIESLAADQEAGFDQLESAIVQHGDRMESLLADVMLKLDDITVISEDTNRGVDQANERLESIRADMARQHAEAQRLQQDAADRQAALQAQIQALMATVSQMMTHQAIPIQPAAIPTASPVMLAEAVPDELAAARAVIEQCRAMPIEQKRQNPELFQAVEALKGTVSEYDASTGRRKNVMPGPIFGVPTVSVATPAPISTSAPVSSPANPAKSDDMIQTPFGMMPRSKRKPPTPPKESN